MGQKDVDIASYISDINCTKPTGRKAFLPVSYEIIRSPGDGHCLLHSVASSLWYQSNVKVNTEDIINFIRDEITTRSLDYIDRFNGSIHDLNQCVYAYINDKIYDTPFDDLVLEVIANGLNININIIDGPQTHLAPCCRNEAGMGVFIFKVGEHYDGIKTITHDFIDNFPYRESMCAKVYPDNDDNLWNSHVKLISMNVCGLSDWKLSDEILGAYFKLYDIMLLQETWTSSGDVFSLNGYEYHNFPRKYKHHLAVRNSGGLGVLIKSTLAEGVRIIKSIDDIMVWLWLDKGFFGLDDGIYVANVYVVPESSVFLCHDVFDMLCTEIEKFPTSANVLICGDANARTNVIAELDGTVLDGDDGALPTTGLVDEDRWALLRNMLVNGELIGYSEDKGRVNKHGAQLIELCKTIGLLILNGRVGNDKGIGELTRVDTTGCSTVDYMICNPELFDVIKDFTNLPKVPESDHRSFFDNIGMQHVWKMSEFQWQLV